MALALTLSNKVITRTDSTKFSPHTQLDVNVTLSTGWTGASSVKAIVSTTNASTEIALVNNAFQIPANYVGIYGFTLKFVGVVSGYVVETVTTKYFAKLPVAKISGLPDLPAGSDNKKLIIRSDNGDIDWHEFTVID